MTNNLFIALEGIDGSGKSTQAKLLSKYLSDRNHKVYTTFEPTTGAIGTMIRSILRGSHKEDDRVIAGLFVADRLHHLLNSEDGIVKKMADGYSVICDRYCFSSYAYQGTHMSMDWVINANAMSAATLRPTVNVFIDVDPATCMNRIAKNREEAELYETLENLSNVRAKFFEAFEKLRHEETVLIINGNQPVEQVAANIIHALEEKWILPTQSSSTI